MEVWKRLYGGVALSRRILFEAGAPRGDMLWWPPELGAHSLIQQSADRGSTLCTACVRTHCPRRLVNKHDTMRRIFIYISVALLQRRRTKLNYTSSYRINSIGDGKFSTLKSFDATPSSRANSIMRKCAHALLTQTLKVNWNLSFFRRALAE